MPGAGIQSLTLALSCLLIICTGTLIGSITITTWNDLLRKARDNGDEGGELDIKKSSSVLCSKPCSTTLCTGVTNVAYEALPFSPAYPHPLDLARSYPWGGSILYFRATPLTGIQRNDTPIALLLESRDMFTNTFQHGPMSRIGEAGPDGNMWNTQRGCNCFSD